MNRRLALVLIAFFLVDLICTSSAQADNGAIAYAYPLSNIEIDGDLSDWPENLQRYPIQINNAGQVVPADDHYAAEFRVGYELESNALFIAIEVTDQLHSVADDTEVDWINQDGVILYFDRNHEPKGSGAVLFSAVGPHRDLLTGSGHWDADVENVSWDNATVEVARRENTTVYEWRIQNDRGLEPDTSLGLDILISDTDDATQATSGTLYVWGPGLGKSQAGGRMGDLFLVGADTAMGMLQGQVNWQAVAQDSDDDHEPPRPQRARVSADQDPGRWLQTAIDDSGNFQVQLPVGRYIVSIPDKTFGDSWRDLQVVASSSLVTAQVHADQTTTASVLSIEIEARPDVLQANGVLFEYTPEQAASVDRAIQAMMAHYQIPGLSVALVKDAELVYHRVFGTQNAYSGEPVDKDTLFEAASVTKIAFAFVVNRMAERGEIDMDKPLYQYLPFDDIAHDERYKKITARYVLSHQTGFPNWRWQNDDGQLDIKFYPGIKYGYSGEGFEYLGRVVAHIAEKPLEQLVLDEVLLPMGFAENTHFSANEALAENASRGHWDGKAGPYDFPEEIGVAHSMNTEAKTLSNFMINLIKREGLSAEGYAKMLEPQIEVPLDESDPLQWPQRFGLGFHMTNSPYGLVFGHGGNNGNFLAMFEIYDEHDMGYIVFANSNTGQSLINHLREYLIIGQQPELTQTAAP
ncbi:MAG: serine hydrolase [Pseudomonadota bacterium]